MTGNNFLDSFIFALFSFIFYKLWKIIKIRYKNRGIEPNSYDDNMLNIRMWFAIILFLLLSIISLIFW